MQHSCKVIAVANQKGGVGKTTTTAALGAGLVKEGFKTLLIDMDPQGNLTISFGWREPDDISVTIATLMGMVINDEPMEPERCILAHDSGVITRLTSSTAVGCRYTCAASWTSGPM